MKTTTIAIQALILRGCARIRYRRQCKLAFSAPTQVLIEEIEILEMFLRFDKGENS